MKRIYAAAILDSAQQSRQFRHPLSIAEIVNPTIPKSEIRPMPKKISAHDLEKLLKFGGYPDPFINGTERFYNRWRNLRLEKLFYIK